MNQRWLDRRLRYWQRILRLQDWNINGRVEGFRGMPTQEDAGTCNVDFELKEALIRIMDPVDHNPNWIQPFQDVETTLVHELLEIHFDPFKNSDKKTLEHKIQEQVIESLAKALVELERKCTGTDPHPPEKE